MTHILGETFYTVVPFLYGPYYAKLSVVPISPELMALTDKAVDLKDKPDGLREAVKAFFLENDASWEVRIQLATDLEKMPVEDASAIWPEDLSPYVAVAQIDVPANPRGQSKAFRKSMKACHSAHGMVLRRTVRWAE